MGILKLKALIITLSDRASRGDYEDTSGAGLEKTLTGYLKNNDCEYEIVRKVIPDEAEILRALLLNSIADRTDFIFTTGGTGIGVRDITPDVVRPLLSKEIPGIMEVIRVKYGQLFPAAALSRSIAGVASQSLVYCLPGNPKAVAEYMDEILKTLLHCYQLINNQHTH